MISVQHWSIIAVITAGTTIDFPAVGNKPLQGAKSSTFSLLTAFNTPRQLIFTKCKNCTNQGTTVLFSALVYVLFKENLDNCGCKNRHKAGCFYSVYSRPGSPLVFTSSSMKRFYSPNISQIRAQRNCNGSKFEKDGFGPVSRRKWR